MGLDISNAVKSWFFKNSSSNQKALSSPDSARAEAIAAAAKNLAKYL